MTSGAEFKKNNNGERFFDLAIRKEHKDVCVAVISHERYILTHTKGKFLTLADSPKSQFNYPLTGGSWSVQSDRVVLGGSVWAGKHRHLKSVPLSQTFIHRVGAGGKLHLNRFLKKQALIICFSTRWRESLMYCSKTFGCPVIGLIKHLPEVCMVPYKHFIIIHFLF